MNRSVKATYRLQAIFLALLTAFGTSCGLSRPPAGDDTSVGPTDSETTADQYIKADFSHRDGAPLVKKFGMFDSGLVKMPRTERDMDMIDALRAESLRVELGMGRGDMIFDDLVAGNSDDLQFKWSDIDRFAELLNSKNVHPYLAYGYCPYPLQDSARDARSQPVNLEAWKSTLRTIAAHFKESGISVGYHEIWNEPDCGDMFYTGSWSDYCELYAYGATGIREGNPDAVVGGPSTAWIVNPGNRYREFLTYVNENELPLDFFSMHHYGSPEQLRDKLNSLRDDISKSGDRFVTTPIHINEINTIASPSWNYGGPCDSSEMAANVFRMIDFLAEQNDVHVVSWAQFLESGVDALGIVNSRGRKKAAYNAFAIYARMPEDRYGLTSSSRKVSGMASADEHRASVVMWNNVVKEQSLYLELSSLPFDSGTVTVYRIDSQYAGYGAKYGEELVPSETIEYSGAGSFTWSGTIPKNSVVYIEVNDSAPVAEPTAHENGVVVRREYYFSDRGATNYAYFDEQNWIARLGSGRDNGSYSVIGVVAESLSETLNISFDIEGIPAVNGKNSVLGMRVEFETASGYTGSVLFHGGIYDENRDSVLPWGSDNSDGQAVKVDLSSFSVRLSDYAPDGWNGRVLLIFEMQDCGKNISAVIKIL